MNLESRKKNSVAVIFDEKCRDMMGGRWQQFDVIVAYKDFEVTAKKKGVVFKDINELTDSGSIYEASAFAEELSYFEFPGGSRISKSYTYKGYELWWIHYSNLFLYFCFPYSRYRRLLEYLVSFQRISIFGVPHKGLFSCFLRAHNCEFDISGAGKSSVLSFFPFGVFLQIILTCMSLPFLAVKKPRIMVFTGDKFDMSRDYDFRMRFIYEELRKRRLPFVEFIRSLESWKTVLGHFRTRKRAVVYSEAVTFLGRFMSMIFGGHALARRKFGFDSINTALEPRERFKFFVATQYLLGIHGDIWAIRIMKMILRIIGVKVALIPAAMERNFHAVLGCKLNNIPTIGILHGAASRFYNVYDFMPGFDGEKMMSVDKYGLWSEWWREYYIKHSKAYLPSQLFVSGPMRPLLTKVPDVDHRDHTLGDQIRVLFVSEQLAVPQEVLPYLTALMKERDVSVYLTFRPYRDEFEIWLRNNHPEILGKFDADKILRHGIADAIEKCDFVVGSHSTAVLEALLSFKPVAFFSTKKWGDYFDLKEYDLEHSFFAETPEELLRCVHKSKEIPAGILKELRERFFGDPYKNGSRWMVEEAEKTLRMF